MPTNTRMFAMSETGDLIHQCDRYRGALERLVAKLGAVEADESFQGIWVFLHVHGYRYSGPDWRDDLADARTTLSAPRPASDQGR